MQISDPSQTQTCRQRLHEEWVLRDEKAQEEFRAKKKKEEEEEKEEEAGIPTLSH